MTFNPDESQKHALLTWYNNDNPLHFEPRHPVIALAGEAGELLDLFKKNEYKPNFSWWKCKVCGFMPAEKRRSEVDYFAYTCMNDAVHTPLILDELGDYSYYLRILAYQKGVSFEELCECGYIPGYKLDMLLAMLNEHSAKALRDYIEIGMKPPRTILEFLSRLFLSVLVGLDTTLQTVLDLNYKKLNSEPSNHGWHNA